MHITRVVGPEIEITHVLFELLHPGRARGLCSAFEKLMPLHVQDQIVLGIYGNVTPEDQRPTLIAPIHVSLIPERSGNARSGVYPAHDIEVSDLHSRLRKAYWSGHLAGFCLL